METKIYTIETIEEAGQALKNGQIVAFPTETVYGLGAIASNEQAVSSVYQVKGRPSDNPLIVHVSTIEQVIKVVESFPLAAKKLTNVFWPGPLTIILPVREGVFAPSVTGGRKTVAFRMPDHSLALALISACQEPIVGPSANKSGRPSPTKVSHVMDDFDGQIAGICDGGMTQIGLESTVLDLSDPEQFSILRPGFVSREAIEEVLGLNIHVASEKESAAKDEAPRAPGMKYRHYAPETPVMALSPNGDAWQAHIKSLNKQGNKIAILANQTLVDHFASQVHATYSLGQEGDIQSMAHHLFDGLRQLDKSGAQVILVESSEDSQLGLAYMNRLKKAVKAD